MNKADQVKTKLSNGEDFVDVARWIIDQEISKHAPVSLDDLPDTGEVASEVEAVAECLEQGDIGDAFNIAEESAILILEEEGFKI